MENKIDLDAIIENDSWSEEDKVLIRGYMGKSIRQALVLASDEVNAALAGMNMDSTVQVHINDIILHVEKLIV